METKIIEIIGSPGSGKSYLCNKICKKLKDVNILNSSYNIGKKKKILRIAIKSYYFLLFFVTKFDETLKIWSYLNLTKKLHYLEKVKVFYNFIFIKGIIEKNKKKYKYILFDQGLVQGIYSCLIRIEASKKNKDIIIKLLEMLKIRNYEYKIIFLDIDKKIIKKRLINRKGKQSNLEKAKTEEEMNKKLNKTIYLLEEIKATIGTEIVKTLEKDDKINIFLENIEKEF